LGLEVGVVPECAFCQAVEEGGVFFVGEVLCGNVIWFGDEGTIEGVVPLFDGLAGDEKHQAESFLRLRLQFSWSFNRSGCALPLHSYRFERSNLVGLTVL